MPKPVTPGDDSSRFGPKKLSLYFAGSFCSDRSTCGTGKMQRTPGPGGGLLAWQQALPGGCCRGNSRPPRTSCPRYSAPIVTERRPPTIKRPAPPRP